MAQPEEAADPLELEHMIGFAASHEASLHFHPTQPDTFVCYTGCLILVGSVSDPHQQSFLRGHDEEITCLALSPSGNLIASGQASRSRSPHSEPCVLVWDFASRQMIYRLCDLHDGTSHARNSVMRLAFSPDDHFLAGSDNAPSAKLCVWDMPSGSVAAAQKQKTLSFVTWGPVAASERKVSRHNKYRLFVGMSSKIWRYKLEYDVQQMQFALEGEAFKMPSAGLDREYFCAKYVQAGTSGFVIAGSSAGELCVFNADSMVFRAAVPVSSGGLLSLATTITPNGKELVYCGCGDGKLKVVSGVDQDWAMEAETRLSGQIRALSASADGATLLAGTSSGDVYILAAATLEALASEPGGQGGGPFMSSHTDPIGCVAFGESSEMFASGANNGVIRLWELSHYSVKTHIAPSGAKGAAPTCLVFEDGSLISGWSDGAMRCHGENGAPFWEVPCTHAGGVYSIAIGPRYIVTGGADSNIRIWDKSSRRALAQFAEHKVGHSVTGVAIDRNRPNLIHSCCTDKSVVTIDLKQERRVQLFTVAEGAFTGLIQSVQGDQELITADTTGCIKVWDADLRQDAPIAMLVTWTERDEMLGREKKLNHLSLDPLGDHLLLSTAAGEIQVWRLSDASAPLSVGLAHSHEVTQANFSPDGKQIVSVSKDACVCVWNWFA